MENSFQELLEAARQGSDEAASDLVHFYGPHVLRTVRRTLSQEIRCKFDSEDFSQAVWASFFSSPEQFSAVTEPKQLFRLLATMARNKVIDEVRRRIETHKYSVRREQRLTDLREATESLRSRESTPSQFAMAREKWIQMLKQQPQKHRRILRLKLMGRANKSIATALGVSERTVRRVLDKATEMSHEDGVDEA